MVFDLLCKHYHVLLLLLFFTGIIYSSRDLFDQQLLDKLKYISFNYKLKQKYSKISNVLSFLYFIFCLFISYRLFIKKVILSATCFYFHLIIYICIYCLCITHAVLTIAHTPFIRDIHYCIFKHLFDNQFQVLFINHINRLD